MISVSRVPEVAITAVSGPGAAKHTHSNQHTQTHTHSSESDDNMKLHKVKNLVLSQTNKHNLATESKS